MKKCVRTVVWAVVLGGALGLESRAADLPERPPMPPGLPDLARGEGPDAEAAAKSDWYLHCGGSRGWAWRDETGRCDRARQILVTHVPVESPVRHDLRVGDVILGVNGEYFSRHPINEFRDASRPAQAAEGSFEVILWRRGWDRERRVTLSLGFLPLDFTKGDQPGLAVDWNLGPTGARGWVQGRNEESIAARQILVTSVDRGSPAEGLLRKGDVILGVEGGEFDRDARRAFGEAITRAETEAGAGRLVVRRFRDGTITDVVIPIEVLGSYSETTPWDCEKSQRISDRALEYLIESDILNRKSPTHGETIVAALALMSTGDKEHMKLATAHVGKLLQQVESSGDYPPVWGFPAWGWGYGNLLMTEYYLLTGDKAVLPAIRKYSEALARGQSGVGSWGHAMAMPNHGHLNGYGAMNQAGIICWMSLILARECGVSSPEIEQAIRRGHDYLAVFIDRQSIPYGDHIKIDCAVHDDNGKNSGAAVAFSILGDVPGTAFFSRMTIASHAVRERGHTGNWWSFLWGPLGAARAGRQGCSAFLRELTWLHDLERRWDGGFSYQGKPGVGYGVDESTGRQRNGAEHQYPGWDTTGGRILMYSLPRNVLRITGRDTLLTPIPDAEVAATIEAGRPPSGGFTAFEHKYDGEPVERLLQRLGSWSPAERLFASLALSRTEDDPTEALLGLLHGSDRHARYGACTALRKRGSLGTAAFEALLAQTRTDDPLLQGHAMMALGAGGGARAVRPLLELAAGEFPNDPGGFLHRIVATALFARGGPLAESIDGVERGVLYPAVRRLLRCPGGQERSLVADAVLRKLDFEELQPLWPAMIPALRECAPTGVMFASGVRLTVAELLAKNHVEEGMPLLLEYMQVQKMHGSQRRNPEIMALLKQYGAAARELLPDLKAYLVFLEGEHPHTDRGRPGPESFYRGQIPWVRDAIDAIKASRETPRLTSIRPFLND